MAVTWWWSWWMLTCAKWYRWTLTMSVCPTSCTRCSVVLSTCTQQASSTGYLLLMSPLYLCVFLGKRVYYMHYYFPRYKVTFEDASAWCITFPIFDFETSFWVYKSLVILKTIFLYLEINFNLWGICILQKTH